MTPWLFSTRYFDYEIKPVYLRSCPLPDVNNEQLRKTVEKILDASAALESAQTPHARDLLRRKIRALERAVDEQVEELFGLRENERRFIDPFRWSAVATAAGQPEAAAGDEAELPEP
jgi:hypothetical protein